MDKTSELDVVVVELLDVVVVAPEVVERVVLDDFVEDEDEDVRDGAAGVTQTGTATKSRS